jgi:hypothetical protein
MFAWLGMSHPNPSKMIGWVIACALRFSLVAEEQNNEAKTTNILNYRVTKLVKEIAHLRFCV